MCVCLSVVLFFLMSFDLLIELRLSTSEQTSYTTAHMSGSNSFPDNYPVFCHCRGPVSALWPLNGESVHLMLASLLLAHYSFLRGAQIVALRYGQLVPTAR